MPIIEFLSKTAVFLLKISAIVLLGGALFSGGWLIWFFSLWETYTWNQELTVVVETPLGPHSGSAVVTIEERHQDPCHLSTMNTCFFSESYGEATIVRLPNNRYLFALLVQQDSELTRYTYYDALDFRGKHRPIGEFWRALTPELNPQDLPPEHYPLLVYFEDIDDPASAKEVDPDDLVATFGPGYNLKSITLDITESSATQGEVDKILGWLDEYKNKGLDGERIKPRSATRPFANILGTGNFRKKQILD